MATYRLNLRSRAAAHHRAPVRLFVSSESLSRIYFPSRGFPQSLSLHALVLVAVLLHPVFRIKLPGNPRPPARESLVFVEPEHIMFLPELGGGSDSASITAETPNRDRSGPAGKSVPSGTGRPAAPAPGRKGLSYPGPQLIISDVPGAKNAIQTLLQPGLREPLVLAPPLTLPNFVQIASAAPAPVPAPAEPPATETEPPKSVEPRPAEPIDIRSEVEPAELVAPPETPPSSDLLEPPKPSAPPPVPEEAPRPEPPSPLPAPAVRPQEPPPEVDPPRVEQARTEAPPDSAETPQEDPPREKAPVPTRGQDQESILSISPMPAKREQSITVPEGEARGSFVISPLPNLGPAETTPGTRYGSRTATTVTASEALPATTAPEAGASPSVVTIGGFGGGADSGKGSSAGSGTGSGTGSGSGAGIGAGAGPFAGITIVGGAGPTGGVTDSSARMRPAVRPLQRGSYGVTIISTESSGGGLPFSGLFGNQRVYTVYLDMRETETDPAPSWTFEFALAEETGAPTVLPDGAGQGGQGIVLPFPTTREQPMLPAEAVRQYFRRLVIVYGVITAEGRMEQMSVKDSPWPLLNEPVMSALSRWVFRPARLNGRPVAMKVLIGIPLWQPD